MSESDLVRTLCSLQLIELMYQRLTKDVVHSKQSPINKKYCGSAGVTSGKEMTTAITKFIHHATNATADLSLVFINRVCPSVCTVSFEPTDL